MHINYFDHSNDLFHSHYYKYRNRDVDHEYVYFDYLYGYGDDHSSHDIH
jgi:hypothetical protein